MNTNHYHYEISVQAFFDNLEIWAGLKINDLSDALAIADTVLVEVVYSSLSFKITYSCSFKSLYNITPSWANSSVLAQLRQILDLSYYELFDWPEMTQIQVG